jgi:branched-chain amino acid transport system substrate-binding protein
LKKILFLIIATLMVMGLVLPGCGGGGGGTWTPTIYVAVVGPFSDIQGQNHLGGAQMARDEINAAGGVNINGTMYKVALVEVETAETAELTGLTGKANLLAAFSANPNITFCVGGFRTECLQVYREVAMDEQTLFMNAGAATDSLQFSVVTNYSRYKYFFKSTPYNSTFLVKSCLKMTSAVGAVLNATLYGYWAGNASPPLKAEYQNFTQQRVAVLMENTAWCDTLYAVANYYLPALGYAVVYSGRVSPTATDISTELNSIKAVNPHMIFTAFSGSVGATFSNQKASLGVPGMAVGINVPAQQLNHWVNTGGNCKGEVLLDTWAENLSNTPTTVAWFDSYVTRFGRYPVYTAGSYDAVKLVCKAIDQTNSLNSDDLVTWLENPANAMLDSVASPKIMTYPAPGYTINATIYALCETQVQALYPNALNSTWIRFNLTPPYFYPTMGYWINDWLCGASSMPQVQHDLVYGPGLTTGVGAQWQNVSGAGKKVGVWPTYLGPSANLKLTDQYGCWNFQYPGTKSIYVPIQLFF